MNMMKSAGAKCPLLSCCCVDWQCSLPLLPQVSCHSPAVTLLSCSHVTYNNATAFWQCGGALKSVYSLLCSDIWYRPFSNVATLRDGLINMHIVGSSVTPCIEEPLDPKLTNINISSFRAFIDVCWVEIRKINKCGNSTLHLFRR
jgi:hypothetical protein